MEAGETVIVNGATGITGTGVVRALPWRGGPLTSSPSRRMVSGNIEPATDVTGGAGKTGLTFF